ncbi:uncharacterized protein TNCV_1867711 [Trichonephila clavipes]|nr:uncharacterized protein TNCV_1867711 [Trichonephila clavipes]
MDVSVDAIENLQESHQKEVCVHPKCSFKEDILEISRKVIQKHHKEFPYTPNGVIAITIPYDETWQKRGHSSLFGIEIVIDILTGLIINYEIRSKYYPECTTSKRDRGENSSEYSIWSKSYQVECSENYVGSSNVMEIKAAEILWKEIH